jgi:hypothetical protein
MKTGIELITEERKRQIESEGYTPQHDSEHDVRELVHAAITYARSSDLSLHSETFEPDDSWHEINEPFYRNQVKCGWPWDEKYFKPTTPLRDLIKAGALIAAAIDRLNAGKEG